MKPSLLPSLVALSLGISAVRPSQAQDRTGISFWDSLPRLTAPLGLKPANQLQLKGAVMGYVTRDSLVLELLEAAIPLGCAPTLLTRHRLFAGPLDGPAEEAPPAFALLEGSGAPSGSGSIQAAAAYVRGSRIHRLAFAWANKAAAAQVREDTASLRYHEPGQPALVIAAGKDAGIGRDSSLLVTSWHGTMEWISWTSAGFGNRHGLPMPVILSRFAGGTFGGADGKLYRLGPDTLPVAFAEPASFPPDILHADGALWNVGAVLLAQGRDWTYHRIPPGTYSDFRPMRTREGLIIHLFGAGAPITRFLGNRPSHIQSAALGGSGLRIQYATSTALRPGPGAAPETLSVVFGDPEGNYEAPRLERVRNGEILRLAGDLVAVDPQGGCAGPGLCLDARAPEVRLALGRDSVTVTMALRVTASMMNPFCGTMALYTHDTLFARTAAWAPGDTLRFRAGETGLLFHHEGSAAIHASAAARRVSGMLVVDRRSGFLAWPHGRGMGSGARAELMDPAGRRMGSFGLGEKLTALPPGPCLVRWPPAPDGPRIQSIRLR